MLKTSHNLGACMRLLLGAKSMPFDTITTQQQICLTIACDCYYWLMDYIINVRQAAAVAAVSE